MSEAVAALAEPVRSIASLAGDAGLRRGDVLDFAGFSYDTGIALRTAEALRQTRPVPCGAVCRPGGAK